ncbi:unnamed protein product, partial [Durusdinium trenchii]
EMKGKGQVDTWLYRPRERRKSVQFGDRHEETSLEVLGSRSPSRSPSRGFRSSILRSASSVLPRSISRTFSRVDSGEESPASPAVRRGTVGLNVLMRQDEVAQNSEQEEMSEKARQQEEKFQRVLRELHERSEFKVRSKKWWFSFFLRTPDFTSEIEDKFQRFYHEHTICKKLESRLDRQALALTILTAVEVFCCTFFDSLYYTGLGNPSWRGDSDGFARLPIFLACRGLIWLIIWIWQRLARVNSRLLRHPQEDPPKCLEMLWKRVHGGKVIGAFINGSHKWYLHRWQGGGFEWAKENQGDDGQDPWSACWNFVEQKRDEWQAECQACEDACYNQEGEHQHCTCWDPEGECDYWRKEEAARRECMDDYCTRFVSGGDTGSLYRWGCIYPRMSFLDSRKADCLAECQATGGPNPVAPKSCRAQLNPATATEDVCWKLGQGWIDVHYAEIHNWDWSLGPPPPESCVIKSYDVGADGKPYVPPPPYGPSCLPECENEMDSCIHNPQCWNWLEVEQMSVWDKCKGRFDTFQEQFRACMDSKWATCSGLGCLRIHRECRDSVGLAEDPVFKEMSCGGCDGEWSSYSARQLYCAEDLSNPKCRWDETTQTTQSQACAPSCMWEVCQKAFNECQINGGTLAACNDQIISMNQCRECYFVSCEAKCSEGACDAAFSSRDQAYRECAACDDTVACNPNSPCYGDNGDSSCNWLWKPEFGTSCPILCEESIRICQESVQGHCHKWLEDQEKSMWDICHEEYDQYRPQMDECIATGTDAAEPRRLRGAKQTQKT